MIKRREKSSILDNLIIYYLTKIKVSGIRETALV